MMLLKVAGFFLAVAPVLMLLTHLVAWVHRRWSQKDAPPSGPRPWGKVPRPWGQFIADVEAPLPLDDVLERWPDGIPKRSADASPPPRRAAPGAVAERTCSPLPGRTFVLGRWYRGADGKLVRLEDRPWHPEFVGDGTFAPCPEDDSPAKPRRGEWWSFVQCAKHPGKPGDLLMTERSMDAFFNEIDARSRCGCLVPLNYGAGKADGKQGAAGGPSSECPDGRWRI